MNSQYLKKQKNLLVQFELKFQKEKNDSKYNFCICKYIEKVKISFFVEEWITVFQMCPSLSSNIFSSHRSSDIFRDFSTIKFEIAICYDFDKRENIIFRWEDSIFPTFMLQKN